MSTEVPGALTLASVEAALAALPASASYCLAAPAPVVAASAAPSAAAAAAGNTTKPGLESAEQLEMHYSSLS